MLSVASFTAGLDLFYQISMSVLANIMAGKNVTKLTYFCVTHFLYDSK